ncbi:MAG: TIGR04255 family protein [Actinomycetota bacterium]
MANRPLDLPEFDRPPVVEVAIGVQFEPIKGFRQAHIGLFWNEIRVDYPTALDQPRLEIPVESFDEALIGPSFQVELIDSPPVHRAWFVSVDESLLVQVQDDRLIHNWRHRGGGYPRFEPLLELFWSHFDKYTARLADTGLKVPPVQQAELTYINWIPAISMSEFFRPSSAAELDLPGVGSHPDAQRWSARYPILDGDALVGRLAVEAQPGRRVEGGKVATGFQLALTFRAPVSKDASAGSISALLLLGRNAIVWTFTEMTTPAMHEEWGRRT